MHHCTGGSTLLPSRPCARLCAQYVVSGKQAQVQPSLHPYVQTYAASFDTDVQPTAGAAGPCLLDGPLPTYTTLSTYLW